jgi:type II secretory pathway pseudopilin PulG
MKRRTHKSNIRAFTVAEIMVAVGVLSLLGLVFFSVLKTALVLFAKNTAVNIAHEEAREGINRLTRDIHASVSMPQLCDLDTSTSPVTLAAPSPSPTPISGVAVGPMFAAVTFQNVSNGPNYIWNDPSGSSLIMIRDNYNVVAGQHLLIPFWGALYEQDIYKATAGGAANHSNIFINNDYQTGIQPRAANSGIYAITYYTDRVAYAVMNGTFVKDANNGTYTPSAKKSTNYVWAPPGTSAGKLYSYQNGELHLFKQRYNGTSYYWQDVATVARNLTTAMPFYTPVNPNGGFNTKYVGVKLTATDTKVTNQNFVAVNSLMDTAIDYRTAIALTQ